VLFAVAVRFSPSSSSAAKDPSSSSAFTSRICPIFRLWVAPALLPVQHLPFASPFAFRCHPSPIRARRAWVRDLLLLSSPSQQSAATRDLLWSLPLFFRVPHPCGFCKGGSATAHNPRVGVNDVLASATNPSPLSTSH
jgi:hypothetical protein